jgi:hypothetical protein
MGELVSELQMPSGDAPVTRADLQRLSDHMLSELLTLRRELLAGQGRQQWVNAAAEPQRIEGIIPPPFPFGDDHPWGIVSIEGMDVTIAAGRFLAGPDTLLTTPETLFTITEDASFIGLEYDISARTLSLIGPQADEPKWEDGYWRTWLYFFAMPEEDVVQYVRHNLTGTWGGGLFAVAKEAP